MEPHVSSTIINHSVTVQLDITRCYDCGRFWAIEQGYRGDCPHCAKNKRSERFEALEHAERSIASLRGALTKAKKRGKR
jgi:hypothetical protein